MIALEMSFTCSCGIIRQRCPIALAEPTVIKRKCHKPVVGSSGRPCREGTSPDGRRNLGTEQLRFVSRRPGFPLGTCRYPTNSIPSLKNVIRSAMTPLGPFQNVVKAAGPPPQLCLLEVDRSRPRTLA